MECGEIFRKLAAEGKDVSGPAGRAAAKFGGKNFPHSPGTIKKKRRRVASDFKKTLMSFAKLVCFFNLKQ